MGDGYFSDKPVFICTDNFTLVEVKKLIYILESKFGIESTIRIRKQDTGLTCWRIRIRSNLTTMNKLQSLVSHFFIDEMKYKINL